MEDRAAKLRREFPARVVPRRFDVERYDHDAGMQRLTPVAVATPGDASEVRALLRWCRRNDVSVTPRGAGSSIAANAFGAGLVLDFSRRMNRILGYDSRTRRIRMEPGCVLGAANAYLRRRRRRIGPSPSSEAFCTIGGMVGNNAAGSHALRYGATVDNLGGVRFLTADGRLHTWPARRGADAHILRGLQRVAASFTRAKPPFSRLAKNSSGYLLDRVWDGRELHPHRVLCGSEGTLGLVVEAALDTHPIPGAEATLLLAFHTTDEALRAVEPLLGTQPAALEYLDEAARALLARRGLELPRALEEPGPTLVLDYFAHDPAELTSRVAWVERRVTARVAAREHVWAHHPRDRRALWAARRAVETWLRAEPGPRAPVPFIEDVTVPVQSLADYVREMRGRFAEARIDAPMYGHAGQGNLHVRPRLDLHDAADRRLLRRLNTAAARLALRMGGSLTGEHGDGHLRTRLLNRFWPDACRHFRQVKRIFDPAGLLNPGVIVPDPRTPELSIEPDVQPYKPPSWI